MPPLAVRMTAGLSTVLSGVAWIAATFLPWAEQGVLSSSTLIEAARFVRRGVVDVVPPGSAALLLAPTVAGVVLVGLGGMTGTKVAVVRTVVGWAGCVTALLLVGWMTGFELGRCGPGAFVAGSGVAIFVIGQAVGISAKWPRRVRGAQ